MAEKSTNLVRFYRRWVQNNSKSEQEGHPVGEEFDYVEIRGLGQDKTVVDRKAEVKDQIEYSREWDLYQRGLEQVAEGTPLREWPVMTHGEIVRLNSYGVHTIEAMVALSDAGLQQIGPGTRQLQLRAKAFLEEDAPKAAMANLRVQNDELRAEKERFTNENLRLQARIVELEEHEAEKPEKRGPGRPKKAA